MDIRQCLKKIGGITIFILVVFSSVASAYVGPGAGLSAIGAFLAIVAGVFVAIFGFLWYPIKRLIKKMRKKQEQETECDA